MQEPLEKMKADLKPLEDVRYYVGKVFRLDNLLVRLSLWTLNFASDKRKADGINRPHIYQP